MAKRLPILLLIATAGYGAYYFFTLPPSSLVLTGIVTTHDVEVSPQIGGRLVSLSVKEGDTVQEGDRIAIINTEKVETELGAPVSGTIVQISAAADSEVSVGGIIAYIEKI